MASPRQEVLEDCLDFVGRRVVFSDGLSRLQYFQQFEELYFEETELSAVRYGRLYNISEITEFLAILTQAAQATGEEPYAVDAPPGKNMVPRTESFTKWKASDWKSYRETLVKIQTSMLQRDANASINEILSKEGENPKIDPSRTNDPWFTDKLFKVLDLFKLHEKLAPFREELELRSAVEDDENTASKPLNLPKRMMRDFLEMVQGEDEKRVKKAFLSLLINDQSFHFPSTIRSFLDDPSNPLSFVFFLNRVNKLMRAWASQVLENGATAAGVTFSAEVKKTDSGQTRALKKLQRSRALLNASVEDPLAEAVKVASKASRKRPAEDVFEMNDDNDENEDRAFAGRASAKKKSPKSPRVVGSMLEKKKSATRLTFSPEKESDSEEIEDPKEDDDVLPEPKRIPSKVASPSPSKKLKSQEKMYEGRKMWTDAEKQAVIEGIKEFGVGHWARTKKKYYHTLSFRTSGQIKDCYRTMKKRGELDFLDEVTPGKESAPEEKPAEEEKNEEEKEEAKEVEQFKDAAEEEEAKESTEA